MDLVTQFRALGERNRIELVMQLARGALSGVDLLGRMPALSQPSLSRHMRVLCDAGLVREKRLGRRVLYRLAPGPLTDLVLRRLGAPPPGSEGPDQMSEETSDSASPGDDFQEWLR